MSDVVDRSRATLARRMVGLYVGLIMFGVSVALLVRADLGLDPWDVFHQGLALRTGLRLGSIVILVSLCVLLLWIPLRQRPGIGTLSNALVVGVVVDATLVYLRAPGPLAARIAFLAGGIVLNGLATGLYIGARLGPGPRDGLMTGLAKRGHSIRAARTSIEVLVLTIGWLLGGTVGIGTVLYAFSIGPLAHRTIPWFTQLLNRQEASEPVPRAQAVDTV